MDATLNKQLTKLKGMLEAEGLHDALKAFQDKIWEPAEKITDPEHLERVLDQFTDDKLAKIVEGEKDHAACVDLEPRFNYDEVLIDWLKQVPFFLEMSRWIRKRSAEALGNGTPLPTAAMSYNMETDDFELLYNKMWFVFLKYKHGQEGIRQIEGVTNHEFYHMVWKHVTTRRRDPHFAWNIATDAAINSIITTNGGKLPKGGIIPGTKWEAPTDRKMTEEEKKMVEGLNELIGSWPKLKASDWYFEDLMKWSQENNYEWGKNGIKMPGSGDEEFDIPGIDMHDMWDDIPEEQRQLIEAKLKNIVRKAVKHADNTQNGWGNMPADIRDQIRASVDDQIDWEQVLKSFIGMSFKGNRATSIKKINKRYPYMHPGVKRGYQAHIAVCMDQSGSVAQEWVEMFFGVLRSLSKKVTFTLIPFDHSVDVANIVEWRKGKTPELKRTRCGGTSFDAPTLYVNAPEHRGKWDGMIILTDGECSQPPASRVKRAWVICPNHKLMFKTDELVIQMEEPGKKATSGVVR